MGRSKKRGEKVDVWERGVEEKVRKDNRKEGGMEGRRGLAVELANRSSRLVQKFVNVSTFVHTCCLTHSCLVIMCKTQCTHSHLFHEIFITKFPRNNHFCAKQTSLSSLPS